MFNRMSSAHAFVVSPGCSRRKSIPKSTWAKNANGSHSSHDIMEVTGNQLPWPPYHLSAPRHPFHQLQPESEVRMGGLTPKPEEHLMFELFWYLYIAVRMKNHSKGARGTGCYPWLAQSSKSNSHVLHSLAILLSPACILDSCVS